MRILAFTDLDDTLFQTARKFPGGTLPSGLAPGAVDRSGQPHSFMTPQQGHLLTRLLSGATVIPVTGRDQGAFSRVTLAFSSWAILNHGATVLRPGGAPDPGWQERMARTLQRHQAALTQAGDAARALIAGRFPGCHVRVHHEADLPMMVVVKQSGADLDELREFSRAWRAALPGTPLRYFANANNLTLIHPEISKASAVQYVQAQEAGTGGEEVLTLGLGDSLADAPFMALCDFALVPRGTQIVRALLENELEQV